MKIVFSLSVLCFSAFPLFAQNQHKAVSVDPDEAYKNNCMRCHASVQSYSPSQTATIVRHMRVRANLTEGETEAILRYLQDSPAKRSSKQHTGKSKTTETTSD